MPGVDFRRVPVSEKDVFTQYFQTYLAELAQLNGVRPGRHGLYEYGLYDLYWLDERFVPFFVERDRLRVGLLLLREVGADESPDGQPSLQVAEISVFRPHRMRGIGREAIRFAAKAAEDRGMPLTWSAYMNNDPANALYESILKEFAAKNGAWSAVRSRGVDVSGLARFYYRMTPAATGSGK